MSVIYSKSTQSFIRELNRLTSIAHYTDQRHLKTPKQLKGVRRLYEANTSKFEPIEENREHLIHTLMPMVMQLAKLASSRYGSNIEFDDCISSGLQGAIIATDNYIANSKNEVQPAKLSTYAHSYIKKYINEYCRDVNSILSHGPTKWWHAGKETVLSGNQVYTHDNRASELFDMINDNTLISHQYDVNTTHQHQYETTSKLCNSLNEFDRQIVKLSFGLNDSNKQYTCKEISKLMKCTQLEVEHSISRSIQHMKTMLTHDEIVQLTQQI